ncbi:hypothetical protein ACQ86K_12160 [Mucilaginibacter sp. P19]|uniref:hypothetical protein n=1 Tax=Mucilaginibacter sp. P19 TaxID=3423947 RepID=UPI003D66795F
MAEDLIDENGRIAKVANNKFNTERLNVQPIHKIIDKLNWYRSLFGKVHDLPEEQYELLKKCSNIFQFKISCKSC